MKYIVIFSIIINTAFAGGFFPLEKNVFSYDNFKLYENKESCEDVEKYPCYDIDKCRIEICDLVDNEVLDYIAKSNEIACTDELDCDAKFIKLSCSLDEEKIKNYDLLSVYCAKPIYKIEGKKLAESASKRAAYEAAKASEASFQAAMNTARKSQACGKDAMAYLLVRNASKGLSNAQKKALVKNFADIKGLLETGSLDAAKSEISSASADGVIVTEADKVAINAYIDGCKP